MDKALDCLTAPAEQESGSVAPRVLANPKRGFDHASTLPRDPSLCGPDARVYFLAGAGLIKIGVTTNPTSRIRAIRNSSPVPLELLGIHEANNLFEGRAHCKFAHLRRHGEWFEDTPELRAFIGDVLSGRDYDLR